jgi:hypothetical protein
MGLTNRSYFATSADSIFESGRSSVSVFTSLSVHPGTSQMESFVHFSDYQSIAMKNLERLVEERVQYITAWQPNERTADVVPPNDAVKKFARSFFDTLLRSTKSILSAQTKDVSRTSSFWDELPSSSILANPSTSFRTISFRPPRPVVGIVGEGGVSLEWKFNSQNSLYVTMFNDGTFEAWVNENGEFIEGGETLAELQAAGARLGLHVSEG